MQGLTIRSPPFIRWLERGDWDRLVAGWVAGLVERVSKGFELASAALRPSEWSETAGELGLDLVTVRPSGSLESADELGLDLVAESIISSKVGGMDRALSRLDCVKCVAGCATALGHSLYCF